MRFNLIDQIRGFAVLIMIIFHFFYDLSTFNFLSIDFYTFGFWYLYPRLIVFLFLLCVGLSLPIVNYPKIQWKKFSKRFLKIAGLAIFISVITYFAFPSKWIYFGTLHCIALCSLAGLLFLKIPKVALTLGLTILFLHICNIYSIPWFQLPHPAMDYIPFFPWIGVTLIGIFLNSKNFHKIVLPNNKLTDTLSFLGKHALIIYLVHQPILFGATYLLRHFL